MRKKTVLLFDIDGTLVLTGGAGRRAMEGALAARGHHGVFDGMSFAGMTDRAIVRHGLSARTKEAAAILAEEIEHVLEAYLLLLQKELAAAAQYRILPGVEALLESIVGAPDVAVGLGTGNVKRGAYAKLGHGNIDRHFGFGGFGCDAEDRTELVRAGAQRGAALLGEPLERCRVVVIGDTPKDIAAARGIGAECVAIATGSYAVEALREHAPEHVLPDLTHGDVRGLLLGAA